MEIDTKIIFDTKPSTDKQNIKNSRDDWKVILSELINLKAKEKIVS